MQKRFGYGIILVVTLALMTGLTGIALHAEDGASFEILAPSAGQVIDGPKLPVSLTFQNSNDVPFVRVDFALDGIHFYGGPFRKPTAVGRLDADSCDITRAKNATPGSHQLTIRLTDEQGDVIEHTLTIRYQPATPHPQLDALKPPRVRIVSPRTGDVIDKKTDIQLEASSDSGLKFVKVFIDGKTVYFTNDANSLFTWDPIGEKFTSGQHVLLARAWDLFDTPGDSEPVTVTVVNSWLPLEGNNTKLDGSDTPLLETPNLLSVVPVLTPTIAGGLLIARAAYAMPQLPGFTGDINTPIPDFFPTAPMSYSAPMADLGSLIYIPKQALPSVPGSTAVTGTPALGTPGQTAPTTVQALQPAHAAGIAPKGPTANTTSGRLPMVAAPLMAQPLPGMKGANAASPVVYTVPAAHLNPSASIPAQSLPGVPTTAGAAMQGTPALSAPGQEMQTPASQPLQPAQASGVGPTPPRGMTPPTTAAPASRTPVTLLTPTPQGTPAPIAMAPSEPGQLPMVTAQVMSAIGAPSSPSIIIAAAPPVAAIVAPQIAPAAKPSRVKPSKITPKAAKSAKAIPATVTPVQAMPVKATSKIAVPAKAVPVRAVAGHRMPIMPVAKDPLAGFKHQYVVSAGDTFASISRAYNTTPGALARLNPAIESDRLVAGTKLLLPNHAMRITLDKATMVSAPHAFQVGKGYTMISMRSMILAKGGILVWIPKTREVNAWVQNNSLVIKIGERQARVNSQPLLMPVAAMLRHSRTMIPLRSVANRLGLAVDTDPANEQVTISSH